MTPERKNLVEHKTNEQAKRALHRSNVSRALKLCQKNVILGIIHNLKRSTILVIRCISLFKFLFKLYSNQKRKIICYLWMSQDYNEMTSFDGLPVSLQVLTISMFVVYINYDNLGGVAYSCWFLQCC